MGQQQLLLLVLGIVIVGLAVVAGINAFQENNEKSQKDALVNEAMRIATDVQAYRLKPSELGGAGGAIANGTTLADIIGGSNTSGNAYSSPWGTATLASDAGSLELDPESSDETATITIPNTGSPTLSTDFGE